MSEARESARTRRFSVIVPTFNRQARLATCLNAIARLDYPKDLYELIVIDDGGDNEQAVRDVVEALPMANVRLIRQQNAGPAAARNAGARAAANPYLAFTDDDCEPLPGWLTAFDDAFEQHPDALLGGYLTNALSKNRCAAASQAVTDFAYDLAARLGGSGPGGTFLFATASLACTTEGYQKVDGFDETFPLAAGEDYDFCHRYQHAGLPAAFAPGAVVLHRHAMTLRQFARQHFSYGRGLLHFRRRANERIEGVAERNLGNFQAKLALWCLKRAKPTEIALVALSQAATLCGAVAESRRRV